jgi:hypothetical protein
LGVEVAQWADEIDDLNETTSWRKALGEGRESDGFPKQNEGEGFLYTFWPWPACLSQLDCSWIIDDVDSKLSLSSSVLKLEQRPSCTAAQPLESPSAGERMQPHHATRVDNGAGKARRRGIDDVTLQEELFLTCGASKVVA